MSKCVVNTGTKKAMGQGKQWNRDPKIKNRPMFAWAHKRIHHKKGHISCQH